MDKALQLPWGKSPKLISHGIKKVLVMTRIPNQATDGRQKAEVYPQPLPDRMLRIVFFSLLSKSCMPQPFSSARHCPDRVRMLP